MFYRDARARGSKSVRRCHRLGEIRRLRRQIFRRLLLCPIQISLDLLAVGLVVVRQHVSIGHAHGLHAKDARHLLLVNKSGIGKFREPVEVVKNRVIDAVIAAGSDVGGRHAQVLQEGGVVGAASQIAHRHIAGLDHRASHAGSNGGVFIFFLFFLLLFPHLIQRPAIGSGHVFTQIANKLLQAGHRRRPEFLTGDRDIHVEVGDRIAHFLGMLFCPFG